MPLITILGPTASGKTTLAAHLAARLGDAEISSADSRQVYRGMDIGTGKDLADYTVEGISVPFHLIDICEAGEKYNLFRFQEDFHKAYDDILRRHRRPILCGGTGLYIESVLRGYKMEAVPENPAAAPAQRMEDFCLGKISKKMPDTSYHPGVISAPLHELLPPVVATRLQKVFPRVKMRNYYTNAALLLGVESRTSSPVRIPRDPETLEYVSLPGIFPCGEGAGYAGGIVSSALDGINVAEAVARSLKPAEA